MIDWQLAAALGFAFLTPFFLIGAGFSMVADSYSARPNWLFLASYLTVWLGALAFLVWWAGIYLLGVAFASLLLWLLLPRVSLWAGVRRLRPSERSSVPDPQDHEV